MGNVVFVHLSSPLNVSTSQIKMKQTNTEELFLRIIYITLGFAVRSFPLHISLLLLWKRLIRRRGRPGWGTFLYSGKCLCRLLWQRCHPLTIWRNTMPKEENKDSQIMRKHNKIVIILFTKLFTCLKTGCLRVVNRVLTLTRMRWSIWLGGCQERNQWMPREDWNWPRFYIGPHCREGGQHLVALNYACNFALCCSSMTLDSKEDFLYIYI